MSLALANGHIRAILWFPNPSREVAAECDSMADWELEVIPGYAVSRLAVVQEKSAGEQCVMVDSRFTTTVIDLAKASSVVQLSCEADGPMRPLAS